VTDANVTINGVEHPSIEGFISPTVDGIFNSITDAAFLMYEQVAEKVLPFVAQQQIKTALNDAKDAFFTTLRTDLHDTSCRSRDEAPPLSYEDLSQLGVIVGLNLTEQLDTYKSMGFGMLELPVDPPVDAMSSEHQLAAEAGVPPLLSLRSWWMSALVELGRSHLSNVAFMNEALPQLLLQILPAGSTYTDGTVVMSLDPGWCQPARKTARRVSRVLQP
jgi:hypothetical protein